MTGITSSCDKTDKAINRDTMEADIKSVKEAIKDTDVDSVKINTLDSFVAISKDLDYYIETEKKKNDGKYSLEKYLVSKETFKENSDKFFTELKNKKYTYKQLLNEIDGVTAIRDKYYKELEPVYKEIDSLCVHFQKVIDENQKDADLMKDSLNKIVELKLVSNYETEVSYRDVIAVKIQMINKTDKPIEAMSFAVTLTDKLGNELATLNCKTNDGFAISDIGLWTYERYGQGSETYDKLLNVNASHVTMKQTIKKINLNGELIGIDMDNLHLGDYFHYYVNLDYKTPEKKIIRLLWLFGQRKSLCHERKRNYKTTEQRN
ncbi:MAG: hypothetical protein IPL74_12700 [Bacteroidetes bacterium]|nr:hypothetical protein [Bacteroidota bacterium]